MKLFKPLVHLGHRTFFSSIMSVLLLAANDVSAATQTITPSQASYSVSAGDTIEFDVLYPDTNPAESTGFGLNLHFDSSKLDFVSMTDVFSINILASDSAPVMDNDDSDGNAETDSRLNVAWVDFASGQWPGQANLPATLYHVKFTASEGFTSDTVISFTANTGLNTFASIPVTIALVSENQAPNANDDVITTTFETNTGAIDVLGNDTDPDGDTLFVLSTTNPSHGTLFVTDGMPSVLSYTPNTGFSGVDTFTYTISDGTTSESLTATGTVTITVEEAPAVTSNTAAQIIPIIQLLLLED